MANDSNKDLKETYDFLNKVGPGFCLAKWTQVTIHLASGINHSCHHVGAHKIPLEELAENPNALHNTSEKKQIRKEMLSGKRPTECDYCWRIEDNTNEYSDRVFKSNDSWSQVDKNKIAASTGDEDFYPRYVEVSFSNVCNFKCTYCGPPFSSKWTEEIKKYGPYKTHRIPYNGIKESQIPIPEREHNPYIEAFWKWFPTAVNHMHNFRITGGEPLLSKHTFKVMQHLLDNPQPNLDFAINSNACPPGDLWEKFITLIKKLEDTKSIKSFTLYISAESSGSQAEYSRDGMDWKKFKKNAKKILKNTKKVRLCVMSAFNILSLPTQVDFLQFVLLLKQKFRHDRTRVDFAYVRHPQFLDIKVATPEIIEKYLKPSLNFMENNGFDNSEIYKLNRIYQDCLTRFQKNEDVSFDRLRLYLFIQEYDKRRNKSFIDTFPEYKEFLEMCKGN